MLRRRPILNGIARGPKSAATCSDDGGEAVEEPVDPDPALEDSDEEMPDGHMAKV